MSHRFWSFFESNDYGHSNSNISHPSASNVTTVQLEFGLSILYHYVSIFWQCIISFHIYLTLSLLPFLRPYLDPAYYYNVDYISNYYNLDYDYKTQE
jgi:hypothetical protein